MAAEVNQQKRLRRKWEMNESRQGLCGWAHIKSFVARADVHGHLRFFNLFSPVVHPLLEDEEPISLGRSRCSVSSSAGGARMQGFMRLNRQVNRFPQL